VTLANGEVWPDAVPARGRVFRPPLPSAGEDMSKTTSQAPASVAENVGKVIRVENETLRPRSRSEAITDAVAGFVGTMSFVVAQLVVFAAWIVVNDGKIPQLASFDPFPYPLLSSITSLEAVLLAAFVLMKQNRMGMVADRRDHLDLQVNLLTEQRATQIIQMLDRLSTRLGIDQQQDEVSRERGRHVAVEHLVGVRAPAPLGPCREGANQVRTGLRAGGNWIRTSSSGRLGPR
jgi:uncharacterized membrane protein